MARAAPYPSRGVLAHPGRLSLSGLVLLAGLSCTKKVTQAGGLELLLMTDLSASDLTRVRLEISQETAPGVWHKMLDNNPRVPQEASLPSVASIAAGVSPNQGALIKFTGFSGPNGDQIEVQRVVQTQVPTERLAELKLLLTVSCVGKVMACPTGESCQPNTGACGSNLVDSSTLPTYVPGASTDGGSGTDVTEPETPPSCPLAQSPVLGLTNPEYDRTIRDLLGVIQPPSFGAQFPEDERLGPIAQNGARGDEPDPFAVGFRRDQAGPNAGASWTERMSHYMRARDFVVEMTQNKISQLAPCDFANVGEDACADKFIADFGLRAFRRPLTVGDTASLRAKYDQGRASGDFAAGIREVIASALMSPHFLMIEEGGTPGSLVLLDDYAMASRLSYFIYRSMPDQELFDAAAAGKLHTKREVETQARRMLTNPKAHDGVLDFFAEWLSLDHLTGSSWSPGDTGMVKSPAVSPDFETLKGYMRTETTKVAEMVFFEERSGLSALLHETNTFLNQPLAAIYGVSGITGLDFQLVGLNPAQRAGILTQASILSMTSDAEESSPPMRGFFVYEKVLCQAVPPPPPNVPPPPPLMPGQTNRQRYEIHRAFAACASCHGVIDPVGLAFEEYDAVGRHRTNQNGALIDASGTAMGGLTFADAVDLSKQLALDLALPNSTHDCMATQWFYFALARPLDVDLDACVLPPIQEAFRMSDNLQDLVVSFATSPAFRYARW